MLCKLKYKSIMRRFFLLYSQIILLCLIVNSCSIKTNPKYNSVKKIKVNTEELEAKDFLFENELAIVYFDKEAILKFLKKELKKKKNISKCDHERYIKYISNIEEGNVSTFDILKWGNDISNFNEIFHLKLLGSLLLNTKFSILKKSTGVYEKYLYTT